MELIIYIIFFIIGITFGSFFTLATHRIPLRENITYKRSYCPKCNHRLEFLDLIPLFSYIFLGGKCRYCKNKIKPKYLLLELGSGMIFVLFAMSLNLNIYFLQMNKIIYLFYGMIFISTVLIIGYIEKEKHYIENIVIGFGVIIETMYIIYLYILQQNIYKYVIYLFVLLFLIFIDTIMLKKKGKKIYTTEILIFCTYLLIGTSEVVMVASIVATLLCIAIKQLFIRKSNLKNIPIGYYLSISNIIMLILTNVLRG